MEWQRASFFRQGENEPFQDALSPDRSDTLEIKMPLTLSERHYALKRFFYALFKN